MVVVAGFDGQPMNDVWAYYPPSQDCGEYDERDCDATVSMVTMVITVSMVAMVITVSMATVVTMVTTISMVTTVITVSMATLVTGNYG